MRDELATHSFGARLERHRSNAASEIGGGLTVGQEQVLVLSAILFGAPPPPSRDSVPLASTGRQPRRLSADATSLPPPVLWLVRSAFPPSATLLFVSAGRFSLGAAGSLQVAVCFLLSRGGFHPDVSQDSSCPSSTLHPWHSHRCSCLAPASPHYMNDTTSELLTLEEIFWRDHYDWLDRQGYTLRSRYKPDWAPYWKHSGRSPYAFEDGQILLVRSLLYSPSRAPSISNQTGQVIDSVRKSDGELVALKKIRNSKSDATSPHRRFLRISVITATPFTPRSIPLKIMTL